MEFLAVFIQTAIKMVVIAAVAVGGICLGKRLRDKKDAKQAEQTEKE